MDILDRFLGHDSGTTRETLDLCRALSDEQLDRPLGVDHGTIRASFEHLISAMEMWTDLMLDQPIRWRTTSPDPSPSIERLSQRFELASSDFCVLASRVQAEGRGDDTFVDTWQGRRKTLGAGIVHVVTHNMAHRTHLLAMLEQLGVPDVPEGDALGWERRLRGEWAKVE